MIRAQLKAEFENNVGVLVAFRLSLHLAPSTIVLNTLKDRCCADVCIISATEFLFSLYPVGCLDDSLDSLD